MTSSTNAQTIKLGPHDAFPMALGCMGMSDM